MDAVTHAITTRRSVRGYTDQLVDMDLLRTILHDAGRAPSGTNIQPWKVYVLTGEARDSFSNTVLQAFDGGESEGLGEYYPTEFVEPYLSRRRKVGWDLYGLLGIERGDWAAAAAYHRRNYEFFGAPVGLIFSLHETMQKGGWMDLGLYMSNVMTLARASGLHTCPQAAWIEFAELAARELGLPDDEHVIVGMSLGYEDPDMTVNQLTTERAGLDEYVTFL